MDQATRSLSTAPANAGVDFAAEIEALADLDLHALRLRWRKVLRRTPPANLSRSLLVRILAYTIQAKALGELDQATARYLDRVAREHERRRRAGEKRPAKAPPPVPLVPISRQLKEGTLLARGYEGRMHTVTVVPAGSARRRARLRRARADQGCFPHSLRATADLHSGT